MASRRAHFVDNTIRVNLAKPDEAPGDLAIPAIIRHDARLPVENWRVFVTRALPSERVARRSPGVKNADISLTQKETDALDLTDTSIIMQHGRRLGKNEPNVEIGRVLSSHTGKDGHVYTVNAINTDNSAYGKGRINEYYGDLVKSGAINSVSLRIDAYVDDKGRIAKRAFPELSLVMPGYEPVHKDCGVLDWKTLPEDVRSGLYSKMYSKFTPDQLGKWSICPNEPLLENKYPVELSMERAETQQPMVQANALGADPARDSRRVASFAHLVACYANDVVEENRMTAPFVEIVVEKESPEYLELLQIVSANASSAQAQEPAPAEAGAAIPQPAGAAPAAEALQSAPASSNAAPSETGQAASTADAAGAAAPVVPGTDSTAIYSMLLEILKRIPPSLVPNQQGESRDSAVQKQEAAPETVSAESTQAAAPDSTEGRRQESAEKVDAAPGVPAPAPAQTADLLAGAVETMSSATTMPAAAVADAASAVAPAASAPAAAAPAAAAPAAAAPAAASTAAAAPAAASTADADADKKKIAELKAMLAEFQNTIPDVFKLDLVNAKVRMLREANPELTHDEAIKQAKEMLKSDLEVLDRSKTDANVDTSKMIAHLKLVSANAKAIVAPDDPTEALRRELAEMKKMIVQLNSASAPKAAGAAQAESDAGAPASDADQPMEQESESRAPKRTAEETQVTQANATIPFDNVAHKKRVRDDSAADWKKELKSPRMRLVSQANSNLPEEYAPQKKYPTIPAEYFMTNPNKNVGLAYACMKPALPDETCAMAEHRVQLCAALIGKRSCGYISTQVEYPHSLEGQMISVHPTKPGEIVVWEPRGATAEERIENASAYIESLGRGVVQ